jgi:hypothetical protein
VKRRERHRHRLAGGVSAAVPFALFAGYLERVERPFDARLDVLLISSITLRATLYDLRDDPRERIDLLARRPRLAARMRRALETHFASVEPGAPPEVVPIDAELEEALRALGYLQ